MIYVNIDIDINKVGIHIFAAATKATLRSAIAFAASSWSYPPQTRTYFLSIANPMGRDLNIIFVMGTNKRKQKMPAFRERWHKTHLQLTTPEKRISFKQFRVFAVVCCPFVIFIYIQFLSQIYSYMHA
jgi:hypothetical protein